MFGQWPTTGKYNTNVYSCINLSTLKLSFLIPLAAGVLYPYGIHIPPMFAGAAMALSSVSVVTSSLMLRRYSPPRHKTTTRKTSNRITELTPLL